MATKTRSTPKPDVDFPRVNPDIWIRFGHLPNVSEDIGAVKYKRDRNNLVNFVCRKVAQLLIDHWTKRHIYTKSKQSVVKKLTTLYGEYVDLTKRLKKPRDVTIDR